MRRIVWPIVLIAVLTACGPQSPGAAARICEDRARGAEGPTGGVALGIGSGGMVGDVDIGITSDYLAGRDPDELYATCMRQRVGSTPFEPRVR